MSRMHADHRRSTTADAGGYRYSGRCIKKYSRQMTFGITEQKSQVTGLTETNAAATESVESDGNVQNVEEPVSAGSACGK